MRRLLFSALLSLLFLLPATACQSVQNYKEPNVPLFSGNYAPPSPTFNGTLKVVNWNIRFAERVETAIEELQTAPALQDADILLLQEMDEAGVEAIAQALALNYVYYPASVHSHHGKNFGNAILSKWPLSEPAKLILPFENPKNNQRRTATRAVAQVGPNSVLAYSIHTETVWLDRLKRRAQLLELTRNVPAETGYAVVGGDFNTFTPGSIEDLEDLLGQVDLVRVSAGAEPTIEVSGLQFTLDHIFARGLSGAEAGVWPDTAASDHYPVWLNLTFE